MDPEREEYLKSLKKWLDDARLWHGYCAGMPFYSNLQNPNVLTTPTNLYQRRQQIPFSNIPFVSTVLNPDTFEYVIPPVWKRILAELMDFFILFIIKMAITFILLEGFNFITIEYNGFEAFQKNLQNPKILTIELIHRAIACAYEAYFLKDGMCATPGKRYMGLMVVSAGQILPVPQRQTETVRISNCLPLGLKQSIVRSMLKNLFIGLMLPVCLAWYFFRFNRTGYDVMANSLVVETNSDFINYQNSL